MSWGCDAVLSDKFILYMVMSRVSSCWQSVFGTRSLDIFSHTGYCDYFGFQVRLDNSVRKLTISMTEFTLSDDVWCGILLWLSVKWNIGIGFIVLGVWVLQSHLGLGAHIRFLFLFKVVVLFDFIYKSFDSVSVVFIYICLLWLYNNLFVSNYNWFILRKSINRYYII